MRSSRAGPVDRPIFLTREEFEKLPEYSTSLPTGTTVGKRWKARRFGDEAPRDKRWLLGEYVEVDEPDEVGIRWRPIVVARRIIPPGHEEPMRFREGFIHEPHAPDEMCALGDECETPRLEWGAGSSPPRPYLVPQPWADLRMHGREIRRQLRETREYQLLTRFIDWLGEVLER